MAALGLALALLLPRAGAAQFGFLGSGIVFDPSNFARNVLHYARRLEQMRMQAQQLAGQLAALRKLARPTWREVGPALTQIDALMRSGQALGYNLATIDREFRRTFPGTQAYRDYPAEQGTQEVRTLATLGAALNAAHRAALEFPTAVARLEAMKRQVGAIHGHEEALELNGTIGVYTAEELTLLRQAVTGLTNVQAIYDADEVDRRAQEAATIRSRLAALAAPGPSHGGISLRVSP